MESTHQIVLATAAVAGAPSPAPAPSLAARKKKSRPRKYGPDGSIIWGFCPKPISAVAPATIVESEPAAAEPTEDENLGNRSSSPSGDRFIPHTITVNACEDITTKIISFYWECRQAICILSASGVISSATLRKPNDPSRGLLTYEGRFEILALKCSSMPCETGGNRNYCGPMRITFALEDGSVIGGAVGGPVIAATPVQIVIGTFSPEDEKEQEPKKQKTEFTNGKAVSITGVKLYRNGMPDHNHPNH
ncbi:hypothetical protein vseg_020274 [Gypsophila vaccaria]